MNKVLITGVSRGIGKATAEKFLKEGWNVIGTSTTGKALIKHNNLEMYKMNMLESSNIRNVVEKIATAGERLDVLINNAAISDRDRTASTINIDDLRRVLEVNLIGLIDLTEGLLPYINDGGQVINISSGVGSLTEFRGVWALAYSISKAALNMYTLNLASRLKNRKIIVSSLTPGWVRTDMGGPSATRDVSEPAIEIFDLANSKGESGQFWASGHKRHW